MGIARIALVVAVCSATVSAAALSEDEERAKAHFLAGQSYYDQASYADALKEFNEAYRISKRPALLYNIARAQEGLNQLDKAVESLQAYLQAAPQADDREAVQSRIKNLQERQAAAAKESSRLPNHAPPSPDERPPSPAPVAPAPSPPAPSATTTTTTTTAAAPPRHRVWTWVVGGVGVGLLAAALGTGIASQLSYGDLGQKCMGNVCSPSLSGQVDSGRQLALATDVLWPVGAAAVVTAIVLFVVEGRPARRHASVTPFVTPSTAGVAFAHAF